ncbi:protein MIS12 homolog [Henckelia pumila]|uniref:protein MIS12 homolog n=1 Tax=Henckelia pumila TaxID=405737 RepID=UPI003C6E8F42
MEGSESEAIFESFNLCPQLFINEVLNIVDDLFDKAFDYFLREASTRLKTEGTDRSEELTKGVAYIQKLTQSALNQRMQKWEEYSLRFCFTVPEKFSLPKANESSGDDLPDLDALTDAELDAQLKSLRDKLALVGKESAELSRELRTLERQSLSSSHSVGLIDEALELYQKHDTTELFQELINTASEFRSLLGNLKRRRGEEFRSGDVLHKNHQSGLFNAPIEELQEFLDEIAS